jgi:hypothetical protein
LTTEPVAGPAMADPALVAAVEPGFADDPALAADPGDDPAAPLPVVAPDVEPPLPPTTVVVVASAEDPRLAVGFDEETSWESTLVAPETLSARMDWSLCRVPQAATMVAMPITASPILSRLAEPFIVRFPFSSDRHCGAGVRSKDVIDRHVV